MPKQKTKRIPTRTIHELKIQVKNALTPHKRDSYMKYIKMDLAEIAKFAMDLEPFPKQQILDSSKHTTISNLTKLLESPTKG